MVDPDVVNEPVYGIKLSSVGPALVTGAGMVHEPTNMDLAMKLHYLKGVYFFESQAVQELSILDLKEPLFRSLAIKPYCHTSGRFQRSESGRPVIKCNDCGVRIIEGKSNKTIDEWLLEMEDCSLHKHLVPNQVLGPELAISPLVLIQFTWFKCGGMSLGISWAHVLGDIFSASEFINICGLLMAGHQPPQSLMEPKSKIKTPKPKSPVSLTLEPLPVKRVDAVGDQWITASNCKMETFSFQATPTQLSQLQSKIFGGNQTGQTQIFESLSAVIWQCLAKIRGDSEPRIVTVCRKDSSNEGDGILGNNQIISVVKVGFSVVEADPKELVAMIVEQTTDVKNQIEEVVEKDQGLTDFIVYGGNLTFLNLEDAKLYGMQLKEHEPVYVNYTIDGVGDEGVVLVLPGSKNATEDGNRGRTVTMTLPENQVTQLKTELSREWSIA